MENFEVIPAYRHLQKQNKTKNKNQNMLSLLSSLFVTYGFYILEKIVEYTNKNTLQSSEYENRGNECYEKRPCPAEHENRFLTKQPISLVV